MANSSTHIKEIKKLTLILEKISKMDDTQGAEMRELARQAISSIQEYPEAKYMSGWGKGKDE